MNIVSWLETLNGLGFKTAWVLLSLLWQSSILLAAAGLLAFVLRRKRASVRHAVWIIALLAAPALPLLGWFGSYLNAPQAEIPVVPSYSVPHLASPAPKVELYEPPRESTLPPPIEAEEESRISLTAYPWALAFIIYAAGLILFLSLVVAGRFRIGRWIRKGVVVRDTRVLGAFQTARQHFGLKRPFLLVEGKDVQAPMTIRTFRPAVLLPTGLAQSLSDGELRAVAIHEMAHIKRNDGLLLTLASFVRAVLFFHPLVWLACRQISLLAEQVADDAVLEATGEALPYAQMLARLAEGLTRRSLSTELAAGIVLSKSAFLRRVEAILSDRRDQIRKLSRLALLGTILATLISLAIATAVPLGEKSPAKGPAHEVPDETAWQAHMTESERRITDAVNLKSYVKAALLSERLLGDYQRTKTYLLRRWDEVKSSTQEYPRWFVAMHLARCSAHLGDFEEVDSWIARAGEIDPDRTFEKVEEEIALCREWVPTRNALKAKYSANPSLETARELLRAHRMLDEYASMRNLSQEILSRFAGDPWLESEEFQSTRKFLAAYYAPRPLEKKAEEPATIPAQDDQIEAVFQKLHENWNKRNDFAWQKWVQASTIEKAKYLNFWMAQKPPKGFDWEPDEEEATEFLHSFGFTGKGDDQDRVILRQGLGMEGMRLTKDEEAQFSSQEASLIDSLISMDGAAIRDLLAKIQDAPWNTNAAREAGWAAEALGRMGDEGIEALAQEVEKTFSPTQHGHLRYYKMRRLVQGLASSQSPQAIPALRRALDLPNRHTRGPAIDGLAKIPGGLTQEILLALWESSDDYIREKAARFLAERGDEKAIETFERDIPTAYAKARYKAEEAVWQIKRRLGLAPGERPERVRVTKENTDPWWQGIEKSIKSPNKGIRVTAVQRLGAEAERNAEKFAPLLEVVLKHPDREVRLKATESTEYAFNRQVAERTQRRENLAPLNEVFDTLAEAAAKGEEDIAAAALRAAYYFRYFEDRPGYQGVIKRVLEGMDSSNTPFRASCMWAFQGLFNKPELIRRYVSPAQKEATFRAVMSGLSSENGRYKMDAISVATMLGFTEATPALAEIVNIDKRSNYRSAAARALGKIGDARAIPALEHMAETDPNVDQYGLYSNRETAWRAIQAIQERLGKAKSEKAEAPEFKQVRYFARPWSVDGRGKVTFDGELASPGGGFWKVYYSASDVVDRAEQYTPYNAMLRNVLFKYDRKGNISEIEGYRYGAPWMKQKFSYDEKGQLAEVAFFGPTGKLSNTQRYKYDAEGQMKEMLVYDSKGVFQGTRKVKVGDNGRVVESDHYDAEGKLKNSFKDEYDDAGRQVEYWHGKEYTGKWEEGTTKNKYNDQGWVVERATYNADGKLGNLQKYKYTEDGRLLERLRRSSPIDGDTRTFVEKFKYDAEGRIVESTEHSDGRLGRIRKYNEFQRASEYIEYDREGNISQRTEYDYDEQGRQTQRRFGPDGKLQEILEYGYDEEGRLIRRFYGPDGTLREISGYGRDEKGRQIKRLYGPDDRLERITKYDEFRRQRESILYDDKGNVKERWEYDYDEQGRQVERRLYGPDAKLREAWEYEYDEKGWRIRRHYGSDGKLQEIWEYDTFQRLKEGIRYDKEGKISQRREYEYDEQGRRIETRRYGPDGELIEKEDAGGEGKGAKTSEEAAVKEKDERPAGSEAEKVEKAPESSQNAATYYKRAFELIKDWPSKDATTKALKIIKEGWKEEDKELEEFLKSNKRAFEEFRKGVAKQRCQFIEEEIAADTLIVHLAKARNLAWLLVLEARLYERNGDLDRAIGNCLDVMKLGYHLDYERILITTLTGAAIRGISRSTFADLIASENLTPTKGKKALKKLIELDRSAVLPADIIRGELAYAKSNLEKTLSSALQQAKEEDKEGIEEVSHKTSLLLDKHLNQMADDLEKRGYQHMKTALEQVRQELEETVRATKKGQKPSISVEAAPRVLVLQMLPAMQHWVEKMVEGQGRERLLITSLAVRLFKMEKGRYPERLDELVPEFLDEAPLDPFDLKPLRYKKREGKWIIYSLGPDGELIEEKGTGGEAKGAQVPEEAAVKEKDERPAGSEAEKVEKASVPAAEVPLPERFQTAEFRAIFQEARTALDERRFDDAAQELLEIIERYPEDRDILIFAYTGLGSANKCSQNYRVGVEAFERVMALVPKEDESYLAYLQGAQSEIGVCYYELGEYDEAIKICLDLIEKYPEPLGDLHAAGAALINVVRCYKAEGQYEKMLSFLEEVIDKYPNKELAVGAMYQMADYYRHQKDFEEAIGLFEEITRLRPDTLLAARVYLIIADCQERLALAEEAEVARQKAVDAAEGYLEREEVRNNKYLRAQGLFTLGRTLRDSKRYSEAVVALGELADSKNGYRRHWQGLAVFALAETYERMNALQEAIQYYKKFVSEFPEKKERARIAQAKVDLLEKKIKKGDITEIGEPAR